MNNKQLKEWDKQLKEWIEQQKAAHRLFQVEMGQITDSQKQLVEAQKATDLKINKLTDNIQTLITLGR